MGKQEVTECDVCGEKINTGESWSTRYSSNTLSRWPSLRRRFIHFILGGYKFKIIDKIEGWRRAYICSDCREEIKKQVESDRE